MDNNQIQRNKALGKTVGIDLDDQLYIGGLPSGKAFGVNDNAKTTPTLNGCIRDIELNGKNILFTGKGSVPHTKMFTTHPLHLLDQTIHTSDNYTTSMPTIHTLVLVNLFFFKNKMFFFF